MGEQYVTVIMVRDDMFPSIQNMIGAIIHTEEINVDSEWDAWYDENPEPESDSEFIDFLCRRNNCTPYENVSVVKLN